MLDILPSLFLIKAVASIAQKMEASFIMPYEYAAQLAALRLLEMDAPQP